MRGTLRDAQRATAMLEGIVAGIAADHRLEDGEIAGLAGWLEMHAITPGYRRPGTLRSAVPHGEISIAGGGRSAPSRCRK